MSAGAYQTARYQAFPQAPRDRTVTLTERIAYPSVTPLSPLVIDAKALELTLAGAAPSSAASLRRLAERLLSAPPHPDDYPGLIDELASFIDDHDAPEPQAILAKARTEFATYKRMAEQVGSLASMSEAAFLELLLRVHARLGKGANGFRTGPMMIRPDARGNKVAFPHHRHCRALMAQLHHFLAGHIAAHPALCATVAYAAIIHAHPFTDGNGRTARTMFNLVLAASTGTRHFVPIHVIAAFQRGSFLIKLRRALYGGEWDGLLAFLRDAVRLSVNAQHDWAGYDSTVSNLS